MISIPTVTLTLPATGPVTSIRRWAACALIALAGAGQAAQFTVTGPPGSGEFGRTVTVLPNGNIVVTDPGFDAPGPIANVGAVHLYRPNGTLVSTLRGSTAGDQVGGGGVTALSNGNFVVGSSIWDSGATADAGAVTFASGTSGISGVVSPANSLVGSAASDQIGNAGVTALSNGNYVVRSSNWDNGTAADAGAVTFGSGISGISGVVSPANSLVGSAASDQVGGSGVTALSTGNYVVVSSVWDNGAIANAGAVTFGSGTSGISGEASSANSLVGSAASDQVGGFGVTALSNGNYVVRSAIWDNGATADAGAVTFASGTSGISGVVSPANSLVGSAANDEVGNSGVTALSNSNYVVGSANWDNGATTNAGAITLGLVNGSVVGAITNVHSVLGSVADQGATQTFGYDAVRNQLAVGQPASNRMVLQRTGIATAISIVGDTPDPSAAGQPVTFTATLSASPNAPTDGQVTFTASSGESCVDTTPTATSASTTDYACTITFTTNGSATVVAEYTGSIRHAYSGSGPETHTTIRDPVFANGFESP
jgi:hypothetical protein